MKLSEEQKQDVLARVAQLVGTPKCSLCGSEEWLVSDTVFELPEFFGGSFIVIGGRSVYPVIPTTCAKCGNVVLLSAITLGVVQYAQGDSGVPTPSGEQPAHGGTKP